MKTKSYATTFDVHLAATKEQPPRFVETIEVEVFHNFGEEILTPESSEKIERVKARQLGLAGEDITRLYDNG